MFANQKTIAAQGSVSGTGLHTGEKSAVRFLPAPENSGVQFFHDGKKLEPHFGRSARCTSVRDSGGEIRTVEHLLAAVAGLGITNIRVEVSGPEVPGLDGSALPFVKLFQTLGIAEQSSPREVYRVREPIFCSDRAAAALAIYPAEDFSVAYTLDYDHPFLRKERVDFTLSPGVFASEIAPARTFCTEGEADELRRQGYGLGAGAANTLVIGEHGAVGSTLRFPDECARHKVLDILGDLSLLGFGVAGRVVGLRSGHALNHRLVEKIREQRGAYAIGN